MQFVSVLIKAFPPHQAAWDGLGNATSTTDAQTTTAISFVILFICSPPIIRHILLMNAFSSFIIEIFSIISHTVAIINQHDIQNEEQL